jgi:hypothetical protein
VINPVDEIKESKLGYLRATDAVDQPVGGCDIYEQTPDNRLSDLAGRLVIE